MSIYDNNARKEDEKWLVFLEQDLNLNLLL